MKAIPKRKATYQNSKWKPNCSVCQYMKRNKDFRFLIFDSSYFNPESKTSPQKINRSYGEQFKQVTLLACLRKHHKGAVNRAPSKIVNGQLVIDSRMKPTFEVIEMPTGSTTNHELGLDDFIAKGRDKLARGELQLTATTFLQAIKIKMDNDAKTKDRRVDMLQGLFKGAAPKQELDG